MFLRNPAIFLLSLLLPASLGQTFRVHSPSHLELCASSSSNGFFLVASDSDFRVRLFRDLKLVHVFQPEFSHCFSRSTSLLYRPTTQLQKMVHLQEDVGEKWSRKSFLGRWYAARNTQLCCLAHTLPTLIVGLTARHR